MPTNCKLTSSLQYVQNILSQTAHLQPLYRHDQVHYYMPLATAILYLIVVSIFHSSEQFDPLSLGINIFSLVMSYTVTRSTNRSLYLFYIVYTCVISTYMVTRCKENVFSHLGFAFILPQLMLIGSSSLILYAFFILTQVLLFQYKLKFCILEVLRMHESNPLIQNFMNLGITLYLFMMVSHGITIQALRTRTLELERNTQEHTEASEKHKLYLLGFSHELRNPINSLLGNLQLGLLEKVSDEAQKVLQTAKLCGDVLLQQVNNMLDSGKLEAGKLEVQPVPTQVHELSQRVWAIFSELIRRKNLTGCLRVDKTMPTLLSLDPYRVNQILLNLIGNAIKFTEKGNINISLHWLENTSVSGRCFEPVPYNEEDEGIFEKDEKVAMFGSNVRLGLSNTCYLLNHERKAFGLEEIKFPLKEVPGVLKIVVRDTGHGMTEAESKSLFQKFHQVSSSIQSRQVGTGLGLYITDEICKKMGGVVKAYSKKGVGTTFIACIPTHSLPSMSGVENTTSPVLGFLQEKEIQVIATGESTSLLSKYVEKIRGTLVATANNGCDAYITYTDAIRKGRRIDVMILEADMPKMDGKLCYQKIRKYEQTNGLNPVKIIIVKSTKAFENLRPCGNSSKGDHVKEINKPLYFEEFCDAINSLIIEGQITEDEHLKSFESSESAYESIKVKRSSTY